MGIRVRRFPEHDLTLYVVTAPHTAEEAVRFFQGLDARDATRWLTYFDPTVDMSGLDVASIPRLKRVLAAKIEKLFPDKRPVRAIVCASGAAEQFFRTFWRSYLETGDTRPGEPGLFNNLEAAYDWLGLPETVRAAIAHVVDGDDPAEPAAMGEAAFAR
jgi:hypothetical protein